MSFGLISRPRPPGSRARSLVRSDADRLFDELWSDFHRSPSAFVGERVTRFVPHIDVTESEEAYRVSAELPGLEEKDFEISLEENVLTLKGEKRARSEQEGASYRRAERVSGEFVRRLRFAVPLDEKAVAATFTHGVLEVTLPKAEEAKPKVVQIPIQGA